ncbi:MAG: hypothetical protein ACRDJN_04745 [Chloroflexota bacterium]
MPSQVRRWLPWAVALASLTLWAATAGWRLRPTEGAALAGVSGQDVTAASVSAGTGSQTTAETTFHVEIGARTGVTASPECEPSNSSSSAALEDQGDQPAAPAAPASQGATPTAAPPADLEAAQATFRLCGVADEAAERAIEQLIAGHGFSATLASRPDGCADLTIDVAPQPSGGVSTGRQSTSLNVSAGPAEARRRIAIQIVSEDGVTQVSLGSDG